MDWCGRARQVKMRVFRDRQSVLRNPHDNLSQGCKGDAYTRVYLKASRKFLD